MRAGTRFGSPHHHHQTLDSTNLEARGLAEHGARSGTVVTAEAQTAGRGRQGRVWSAPPGTALLYSAILRPLDLAHLLLPLAVPVAVCEACERLAPVHCRIKWPNDVWLDERKLAGILIEARPPEWAVIGIGVNVSIDADQFPDDLRWPAVSLGHGIDPGSLRVEVDRSLGEWVEAPAQQVRHAFERRDALAGRELGWEGGPEGCGRTGTGAGIDDRGNLLVRGVDGSLATLGSGEVHLRLA